MAVKNYIIIRKLRLRSISTSLSNLESGSAMIFFIACAMPILFTVLFLGFDIGNLLYNRGVEQKILDRAAMFSTQHLPYKNKAIHAAQTILTQQSPTVKNQGLSAVQVLATNDSIELKLTIPSVFSFASKLGAPTFPDMQLRSLARIQPKDVVIFFDSSNYLSPLETGVQFWGKKPPPVPGVPDYNAFFMPTSTLSESEHWKPSTFFKGFAFTGDPFPIDTGIANVRTQQCFNPPFSSIKETTTKLYYSTSMFNLNSVGIISGPTTATTNSIFTLRTVKEGGFPSYSEGEALVENQAFGGIGLRDSHCFTAAEIADAELKTWRSNHTPSYQETNLPQPRMYHAFPYFSTELDQDIMSHNGMGSGLTFTNPTTGTIIAGREKYISAREAVWVRRSHRQSQMDIRNALDGSVNALLQAPQRIDERGPLYNSLTRTAFVILGHMPRVNDGGVWHKYEIVAEQQRVRQLLKAKLIALDNLAFGKKIFIYIFLVRHYNMYPYCTNASCPDFLDHFDDLYVRVNYWNNNLLNNITVKFVRVPGVNALVYDLASYLPLSEQVALLGLPE